MLLSVTTILQHDSHLKSLWILYKAGTLDSSHSGHTAAVSSVGRAKFLAVCVCVTTQ